MRRALALAVVCLLALAGCGSGHHARQSALGSVHPANWGTPTALLGIAPQAVGPTAEMFDSVAVNQIPANPVAVAGYTAGRWPNYLSMVATFPHARHVSIAISAAFHADCLDVEPFDAVPSQVAAWVHADIAAGFKRPCVYSSLWEYLNQVRPALAAGGISRAQVWEWDADYTFVRHLDAGFDATQWTDKALGRNLDESTATYAFLGLAVVHPARRLPVCFHRRESAAACAAAKAKVASDLRAVAASNRALAPVTADLRAHACVRPYRRGVCVRDGRSAAVFAQRSRWFSAAALRVKAAN